MTTDKIGIITELKDKEIKGNYIGFTSPQNSAQAYAEFHWSILFFIMEFFIYYYHEKNETGIHIL